MGEVIELAQFRRKLAADQGFRTWLIRFREQFGPQTSLQDLSDRTLLFLATPGEDNLFAILDLVLGARGWGTSTRFLLDDLSSQAKQEALDNALRLLDYCRFEVLARLGWIDRLPESELPLVDLVNQLASRTFVPSLPVLAADHPGQEEYQKLILHDRQVFIRKLIPAALETFRRRLETDNQPG